MRLPPPAPARPLVALVCLALAGSLLALSPAYAGGDDEAAARRWRGPAPR